MDNTYEYWWGADDCVGEAFAAEQGVGGELRTLLRERGLVPEGHAVVRADIWLTNDSGGETRAPYIEAFLFDGTGYDDLHSAAEDVIASEHLPLKKVVVELTAEQALGLFVRFKIILSPRDVIFEGVKDSLV